MRPQYGETVHVDFTAVVDGRVVDGTIGRDPLLLTVGTGQAVPGFERAVMSLEPGESATVAVPARDAYGAHDPRMVHEFPLHRFREAPRPGKTIELQGPSEQQRVKGVVSRVDDDTVWVDFNHPLAGKEITFEIELLDVAYAEGAGG